MTSVLSRPVRDGERAARPRRYLMCRPEHFAVTYAINPWMDPDVFRTDPGAHAEAARVLGREVVSVELVDPRHHHLDTAVAVLDDATIAWLPDAFSPASRTVLASRFPDAVVATRADAAVLGLNAVSDGRHVVLAAQAITLAAALADRGFVPVPVDLSELREGGGGPECCTVEIRA